MQYVPLRWLRIFHLVLVGLTAVLALTYFIFQQQHAGQAVQDKWGITPLVLGIGGMHAAYILFVYPFFYKRFAWFTHIVSVSLYAILFASIIESSGNTNLVYRFGYAGLVFFMGLGGPYAPIAAVVLTWLVLLFTVMGTTTPTKAPLGLNLLINCVVTVAAIAGWYVFKRWYVKKTDQETLALQHMLKQEQLKSGVIIEAIDDGVLIINNKGSVQLLNKGAATMLGWKAQEGLGLDYRSLIQTANDTKQAAADGADAITLCLQNGQTNQKTSLLTTHNQRQVYIDIVASPIYQLIETKGKESQQTITGAIAVLRDVDKQKREEQQRSAFISTASHEMRTPVASIQGFLELVLNPAIRRDPDKLLEYLNKAHGTAEHLGELLGDLLTIAQQEDHTIPINLQAVEVASLLQVVMDAAQIVAAGKELTVSNQVVSAAAQPLYVTADPTRLQEALENIVQNAIKYTPRGSVSVTATAQGDMVVFSVVDTGIGIAEEDMPHLFEKFYRVDSSDTREIGGTGLGLYIAKQFIEAMGGTLQVESRLGAGSTFLIKLPLCQPPAP